MMVDEIRRALAALAAESPEMAGCAARASARLRGPEDGGVAGETLAEAAAAGRLGARALLAVLWAVLDTLAALHRCGLYHTRLDARAVRLTWSQGEPAAALLNLEKMRDLQTLVAEGVYAPAERPAHPAPLECLASTTQTGDMRGFHSGCARVYADFLGISRQTRLTKMPFATYDVACAGMAMLGAFAALTETPENALDVHELESCLDSLMYPFTARVVLSCGGDDAELLGAYSDIIVNSNYYNLLTDAYTLRPAAGLAASRIARR